jgi:hypothetical protein
MASPGFRVAETDLNARSFQEIRAGLPPVSGTAGRIKFACVFLRDAPQYTESPRFAESLAVVRARSHT